MRAFCLGLCLAIVLGLVSQLIVPDGAPAGDFSDAVVQVKDARGHGSGVMIAQTADSVWILTAGHVAFSAVEKGATIPHAACGDMIAKVVWTTSGRDGGNDIGLLLATKTRPCRVRTANIARTTTLGQTVVMVGFPENLGKATTVGTIAATETTFATGLGKEIRVMVFQGAGAPGVSGGAVFDTDGNVIGLVTGPATRGGQALLRATPLSVICEFLARAECA